MSTETITVLFTDLVGSTALLSRVGEQRAEMLRREHFALLRAVIDETDGREIKNMGDGLMVVFASTRAALGAAVAMQQRLDARDRGGGPTGCRCGWASATGTPRTTRATTSGCRWWRRHAVVRVGGRWADPHHRDRRPRCPHRATTIGSSRSATSTSRAWTSRWAPPRWCGTGGREPLSGAVALPAGSSGRAPSSSGVTPSADPVGRARACEHLRRGQSRCWSAASRASASRPWYARPRTRPTSRTPSCCTAGATRSWPCPTSPGARPCATWWPAAPTPGWPMCARRSYDSSPRCAPGVPTSTNRPPPTPTPSGTCCSRW